MSCERKGHEWASDGAAHGWVECQRCGEHAPSHRAIEHDPVAAVVAWVLGWFLARVLVRYAMAALVAASALAFSGCATSHVSADAAVQADGCVNVVTCLSGSPPLGDCTVVPVCGRVP